MCDALADVVQPADCKLLQSGGVMSAPGAARVGVHNLSNTIAGIAWVDGDLVLLAAQVGQATCETAVLAAWLCTAHT